MKQLSPKERLAFVQSLELEAPKTRTREIAPPAPEITPNSTANYVNDGSLVSFVAGLSAEDKSDVLNGVLLAQLAASLLNIPDSDTVWINFHIGVSLEKSTLSDVSALDAQKLSDKLLEPLAAWLT